MTDKESSSRAGKDFAVSLMYLLGTYGGVIAVLRMFGIDAPFGVKTSVKLMRKVKDPWMTIPFMQYIDAYIMDIKFINSYSEFFNQ